MPDDPTLRTCGRTGCRWPAAASLSFRYATGEVWLLDLSDEPDPSLYDLCPHHADTLTVPRGWEHVDQRSERSVVAEPAGRDLDPADGGSPPGAGGYGSNRYASLMAALPRLAREHQAGEQDAGAAAAPRPEALREQPRQPAVPSRDLAPMPLEAPQPPAGATPVRERAGGAEPPPAATGEGGPGGVDHATAPLQEGGGASDRDRGEAGARDRGEAVVVPIEAGSRRRS